MNDHDLRLAAARAMEGLALFLKRGSLNSRRALDEELPYIESNVAHIRKLLTDNCSA